MSADENTFRTKVRPSPNIYTGVPTVEYDEDRHEKPWQRVFSEVTRKGAHLYEPVKSVPSSLLLVLLGLYLLLGYLTQLVEDEMPRVVNEVDVTRDDATTFSEEAAWRYLNIILGDEPRVSGTEYHLRKTEDLKRLLDEVAGQGNLRVMTDWQFADGEYWITFVPPYVNVYRNVSNVIAFMEGESGFHSNGTPSTSLLVNCHYDSVPFAMGASDNAIFCAVMMEMISKMSQRSQKFKHNIIFLFNGAEENVLQGSHAFLKHNWAAGITNVVNLDAAGMNGKPLVFQVTDPRLLRAYKRVVSRPGGQSVGEFLFKTGVIPSDTDFRIWRDFGNFHGLDIAFVKWSHVYHTRYDHPSMVRRGVIQNAGDMMLRLVTELADMEELDTQIEPSAAVYYDYLYWFMVSYSFAAAVAVDILLAVFALLSVAYYVWLVGLRWSSVQELLYSALGRLASLAAGAVVCTVCTALMILTTAQLRYLSQAWIVVPHYWLPFILTAVCVSQLYDAWRTKKSGLNRSIRALQAQAATRLILALLLIIMTCIPAFTTIRYLITVPLFIMSVMGIVSLTVVRYVKITAWQQVIMEFLFSLPSTMFLMSLSLRFDAIMLPTMGRSPTNTPDVIIAILNVALAAIVTATVSGIELLFSRKRLWMVMSPVAAACIVLMFIPFSPYQDEGPATQRHYWFHSEVITYNYNGQVAERVSGVVVTRWDAYNVERVLPALREKGINLNARTNWSDQCERYIYCNLPLFRVRNGDALKSSMFLSTGPPAAFTPEPSLTSSRSCLGETCTLNFVMIGTAHNLITLWPRENVNITAWSFDSPLQISNYQNSRPVYVIHESTATYSGSILPYNFSVTMIVPLSLQSQPILDVSHHAHKIHHPEDFTAEYRNLLNAAPQYFNIASFISIRKNYVL